MRGLVLFLPAVWWFALVPCLVRAQGGDTGSPSPGAPGAPAAPADTLRVLSFNIHGLLDDARPPNPDPALADRLVDAIAHLDPDVVGFQEVLQGLNSDGSDNQMIALVDSLRARTGEAWHARVAMSHVSWDRFEEGVAILSKHPIVHSEEWALESRDVFQRKLLTATVETPLGLIEFYNTHLAYRSEADSIRIGQVTEIKRHVSMRPSRANQAIVVGDFNAEPGSMPILRATTSRSYDGWTDAFAMLHPQADGFTFSATEPRRRIDYVFVGDPTVLVPVRADVVLDEEANGRPLSDHLGALVDLVRHPTAGKPR